jgi:hypothetical protein
MLFADEELFAEIKGLVETKIIAERTTTSKGSFEPFFNLK